MNKIDLIIRTGMLYIGRPYEYGAPPYQSRTFDCSSFIQFICAKHDIYLPRTSRRQFMVGYPIRIGQLRKGDLVFFTTEARKNNRGISKIGHVALYIGNRKLLHTFSSGKMVQVTSFDEKWLKTYVGARRIITR